MKLYLSVFTILGVLFFTPLKGEAIILPQVTGVVLVGSLEEVIESPSCMEGVTVRGLCLPTALAELSDYLYPFFRDQPLTQCTLQELKCAISDYWRAAGHPFVYCFVPPQDITNGIVQFVVAESRVGDVACGCQRWFPKWQTVGKLHIRPGCTLDVEQISRDLSWVNEHPFHYTTIFLKPGCECFTTDVTVRTCDRYPFRVWVGADNTGTIFTGRSRYFIGGTCGNALGRGHLASFQYMTDRKFHRFQAYFGNYTIPLPWRHYFRAYGGWSRVKPQLDNGRMVGRSGQASVRYDWRFCSSTECCRSGVVVGFDFKTTNNNLEYIDQVSSLVVPVIGRTVNITQFVLGYHIYKGFRNSLGMTDCCSHIDLKVNGYFQPGQLVGNQSQELYNQLSPGAQPLYAYVRAEADLKMGIFCNGSVVTRMACQAATAHLLPSEQFGLGGMYTVRGYLERELNADNAFLLSLELHSAPLLPFWNRKAKEELTLLAFIDYGLGNNNAKAAGEQPINYLLGVGPAVRYRFWTNLYAQADWGFRLISNQFNQPGEGWNWFYFSVVASY